MCGNGALIGMTNIHPFRKKIRLALHPVRTVCFAAARGPAKRGVAASRPATSTRRGVGASVSASASPCPCSEVVCTPRPSIEQKLKRRPVTKRSREAGLAQQLADGEVKEQDEHHKEGAKHGGSVLAIIGSL